MEKRGTCGHEREGFVGKADIAFKAPGKKRYEGRWKGTSFQPRLICLVATEPEDRDAQMSTSFLSWFCVLMLHRLQAVED